MADILSSHSFTFSREDSIKYFLTPVFGGVDLRNMVYVLDNVKSTKKLDYFSNPSKITKAWQEGFSATGSISYTQKSVTVAALKAEVEQNGKVFLNSVKQELLAKGYKESDLFNSPVLKELFLSVFASATRRDLIRQMFFGDKNKETFSSGIKTGTGDADYNIYDGYWTRLINDVVAGTIPSGQRVTINNGAVQQLETWTLTGATGGTITLTVSGVAYSVPWTTSIPSTMTLFYTTHATALAKRGIILTNPSAGALLFTATHPGQGFTVTATSAGTGGALAASGQTVNVAHSTTLGTDEGFDTLKAMYESAPTELLEFADIAATTPGEALGNPMKPVYFITRSMRDNLLAKLESLNASDFSYTAILNGVKTLAYRGIPIIVRPEWDTYISTDMNTVYPHRALLTIPRNLILACDGMDDDLAVETWYNPDLQKRRIRAEYKAGTEYVHKELVVVAY